MAPADPRLVAVVDPVAGGGSYGAEIRALGLAALGVLSRPLHDPYAARSFRPDDFAAVVAHQTVEDTVALLTERGTAAVVAGTQTGLDLTDLLAEALGLRGNPTASMAARSNKAAMKECWLRHGVPCASWYETGSLPAVLSWADLQGYPVVLKPTGSAGSCHVFVCTDEREVARAFQVIVGTPDADGRRFDTVLAEEYLDGDEYFMNLLHDGSGPGEPVSLARYRKIQRDGHASIYHSFRSMPLDDPLAQAVLPHVQAASAALDVRYGINDTEFKLTSRGLRIVEVNNRLPGAGTPQLIEACSGLNCFQENVRILLGEYARPPGGYRYARGYCVCCLRNDRAGRVVGHDGVPEVTRLPSYQGMRLIAEVGQDWPATEDLVTSWGLVWLVHPDPAQLDRDCEAVHGLLRLRVE